MCGLSLCSLWGARRKKCWHTGSEHYMGPPGLVLFPSPISKSHEHLFRHVWSGMCQSWHAGVKGQPAAAVRSRLPPCGLWESLRSSGLAESSLWAHACCCSDLYVSLYKGCALRTHHGSCPCFVAGHSPRTAKSSFLEHHLRQWVHSPGGFTYPEPSVLHWNQSHSGQMC